MKRLTKALMLLILVFIMLFNSLFVFAAEAADDGSLTPATTDAVATTLKIDNQNTYTGMECSYSAGYTPSVSGNSIKVVLPLVSSGEIKDNIITAKVNIDYSSESPFICKNYEKTIALSNHSVTGDSYVSSFLVVFDIELSETRKNGNYPVTISINATDKSNQPIAYESVVYVSISDGSNPDSDSTPNTNVATTLKIDTQNIYTDMDCSYSEGYRPRVSDNTVKIVLPLIPNGAVKDNNVTAKVVIDFSDESPFVCNNYEKTVYLDNNNTSDQSSMLGYLTIFDLKLNETRKNGNYPVIIKINALDANNNSINFENIVYVMISDSLKDNAIKMQFDELQIPTEVTVSDVVEAPIKAINLSKCKIFNVRATMSADGLICKSTAFIGDMDPGTSVDSSFTISVTALSGDATYGSTDGIVTYVYEDENGQEYSVQKPFSTTI